MRMLVAGVRGLGAVLIGVAVLLSGGWSLWSRPSPPPPVSRSAVPGSLHEVPPPPSSLALRRRLAEHQPRLDILSPANEAVLPSAPWTLSLRLEDWPLADAGALGLGAHVAVQLDEQDPIRLGPDAVVEPVGAASPGSAGTLLGRRLSLTMPPLSPGSHRITVYAARPWGESVKDPGASAQIRVHGVAPNPLRLPGPGTAQLVSSTPTDLIHHEPVLIDWLLIDTPLQRLDGDGPHWRLRVTLNGDSFLVDRQTPIWLSGLRPGSNALQLELLDGLGDPLNPPFNSLVRDVVMLPDEPRPWQRPSLALEDQERLLGLRPGEPPAAPGDATPPVAEPAAPAPQDVQARPVEKEVEEEKEPPSAMPSPAEPEIPAAQEEPDLQPEVAPLPPSPSPAGAGTSSADPAEIPVQAEVPEDPETAPPEAAAAVPMAEAGAEAVAEALAEPAEPQASLESTSDEATGQTIGQDAEGDAPDDAVLDDAVPEATGVPAAPVTPAIPGQSGPARDLLEADGTLRRQPPQGALGRLRARFGG
jgi:hypothetical protein